MNKTILITGCILGMIAIIVGAFGAHSLKVLISNDAQITFETGVRYQMYHALLLLFVGQMTQLGLRSKKAIFYLVLLGVLCFSGSIYGLATNILTSFDFKQIGFITPIGGVFLIAAWTVLLVGIFRSKIDKS
ncbi:MAG: DUF423 domain-containing protein [Psychroserpens sp.]|uniref:DUF423 domain-containing protein n=1 Tax=Psychroserpens sp. TaxID=2020870 RepID=UPI003C74D9E6